MNKSFISDDLLLQFILKFNISDITVLELRKLVTNTRYIQTIQKHKPIAFKILKSIQLIGKTREYCILKALNKKFCNKCNSIKSLDNFHSNASYCKKCVSNRFKKYYIDNKISIVQNVAKRQRNLDKKLSKKEVIEIFARDNYACKKCGMTNDEHEIAWGTRLHLDHIIPFSKGGLTEVNNLQLLCISCNSSKSNKLPV